MWLGAAAGAAGPIAETVVNQTPLGRGRTADIGETVAFVCYVMLGWAMLGCAMLSWPVLFWSVVAVRTAA